MLSPMLRAKRPARCACQLFWMAVLAACKKEDPPPAHPAPVATYSPQFDPRWQPAVPPQATAPPPAPAPPAGAAAIGFPCASDADLQCPFARCKNARCGGCSAATDCKAGAICAPTWLGLACFPGATAAPPASPAPPPGPPLPVPAAAPPPGDPLERARIRCTDRTNGYRARVGAAPLERRTDLESCADSAAQSDAQSRSIHGAFGRCRESAQNECPSWDGSLDVVIDQCLDMMFAEGPGSGSAHGHYVNMTNRSYRQIACGVAVGAKGEVWVVQNFYR
jgi:hypothetical protein